MNMHQDRKNRPGKAPRVEPAGEPLDGLGSGLLAMLRNKAIRETIESIVIAFALAFLFKTFEAEAFVIPTGSMAPTLLGRHRDVVCPQCHFPYYVNASSELNKDTEEKRAEVVAATCPQCGYTACVNEDRGKYVEEQVPDRRVFNSGATALCQDTSSRSGDRIVVSKFAYQLSEPHRWDVFVFRWPGDASKNYIKRLVGLPGESLRIYRGDIYTLPTDPSRRRQGGRPEYEIERKPPSKIRAMMQLVNDNDYLLDQLTQKGWPTRWAAWPRDAGPADGDWRSSDETRTFATDGTAPGEVWLRYQHFMPSFQQWEDLVQPGQLPVPLRKQIRPQLITDTYAYNSSVVATDGKSPLPEFTDSTWSGLRWVPDLILECELTVEKPAGNAILELVAGGIPFRCRLDLAQGQATLSIGRQGADHVFASGEPHERELVAASGVSAPGTYRLRFANVDRQLHLWVNDQLVEFPLPATYGPLKNVIPQAGDLAPVGIAARSAAVRVGKLRVYRDIYYIATKAYQRHTTDDYLRDNLPEYLSNVTPPDPRSLNADFEAARARFLSSPADWTKAFEKMRDDAVFILSRSSDPQQDQFLALGDNSPQSSDSRLWEEGLRPRVGAYVERELLIGKALMIYWPPGRWSFVR